MKKPRILFLCLAASLLSSCAGNGPSEVSTPIEFTPSSASTSEIIDEALAALGEIQTGSFYMHNNIITSSQDVSLFKLKQSFGYGTMSFQLKTTSTFSDNGVLLHGDGSATPKDYYFFGFDILGKLSFTKYVNGKATQLYKEKVEPLYQNKYVSVGVYFDEATKSIELYYGNKLVASIIDEEMLEGTATYLKANGSNTSYRSMDYTPLNKYLLDANYYQTCNGGFVQPEVGTFISDKQNSLIVSDTSTFENGTIEVSMQLAGEDRDNGIVFGLSDDDKASYWEGSGIRYYYFFVSQAGLAYLGKTDNGGWQVCATKQINDYSNTATYRLRVTRHDDTIFCFVDDALYIAFTDASPLPGNRFGLRAGGREVVYTGLSVLRANDEDRSQLDDYIVGSGSIDAFDGVIKSTGSKTLAFVKDSNFPEGTLETTFVPGTNSPAGIVFRGSAPSEGSFYENESGLSYYFVYVEGGICSFRKVENGVVTKTTNKYWPYGTATAYNTRILMQGSDIYCYFNDRLVFHYHDENPLQGGKYGIKSVLPNCIVAPFIEKPYQAKDTCDYLIFGHSYTDFWIPTYKQDFAEYQNIYDIGIGGAITAHWCEEGYQNEVVAYEPRWGIYWNSINDINSGISAGTIRDNVRRMCIGIHEKLPNFKLALVGVCRCPIDAATDKRNAIHNVNIYYRQIAAQLDYVYYIDTELMYCDANGNEIAGYFTDGLHPTHEAYIMVASAIKDIINSNS